MVRVEFTCGREAHLLYVAELIGIHSVRAGIMFPCVRRAQLSQVLKVAQLRRRGRDSAVAKNCKRNNRHSQ